MLFDTDILVWVFRGSDKAAAIIEEIPERQISVVTFMELLQGSRDSREARAIKNFLVDFSFQMLPLTENIGHRAAIYMEEYSLKTKMCMGDALVAATAIENRITLCTGNHKHFKSITDLDLKIFRP
ncbi:MAG: type II toxin-antitoxin system VapC family toxin [bacterium]